LLACFFALFVRTSSAMDGNASMVSFFAATKQAAAAPFSEMQN
jgi:hypothetical protein